MDPIKRHSLTAIVSSFIVCGVLVTGCERTDVPTSAAVQEASPSIGHWRDDDHDARWRHHRFRGGLGFHFLSMANAGVDAQGVNHRILMTGTGRFDDHRAVGGGFFNHFDVGSAVPQTLLAAGTWRAVRVLSFEETDHPANPWGFNLSGILEIEIRLFTADGPRRGIPAVLTIVCNIPPAGILTGLPEGYFLEVGDLKFEPAMFPGGFPFGVTSFSVDPRRLD